MVDTLREVIGSAAACLTTFSFVPQALHVIRSKDTRALSLPMYLAFGLGIALWPLLRHDADKLADNRL